MTTSRRHSRDVDGALTLAELEAFVAAARQAGFRDDAEIRVRVRASQLRDGLRPRQITVVEQERRDR